MAFIRARILNRMAPRSASRLDNMRTISNTSLKLILAVLGLLVSGCPDEAAVRESNEASYRCNALASRLTSIINRDGLTATKARLSEITREMWRTDKMDAMGSSTDPNAYKVTLSVEGEEIHIKVVYELSTGEITSSEKTMQVPQEPTNTR